MAPVRTKRLARGRRSAVGAQSIYTAPAGETVIVKDWRFAEAGGTATSLIVEVFDSVSGQSSYVMNQAFAANQIAALSTWIVLQPGDSIGINKANGVGLILWWISGTELEGVAD